MLLLFSSADLEPVGRKRAVSQPRKANRGKRHDRIPANEAAGAAEHAVGYRKPPLHTRFRKGQSGNPAGRPPNSARLSAKRLTLEEAYRAVVVKEDDNGRAEPVPALQAVLRSQFTLAIKGNGPAQRAVLAAVQAIEKEEDIERNVAEHMARFDRMNSGDAS